jgi:hypothetical protein
VSAQDFSTVLGIFLFEVKLFAQCRENIAPTRVPNPARDIFFVKARSLKNRACVTCCESGDFGGEKISKKAVLVIEAKVIAVGRF